MNKNKVNVPKIRFPGFTDPWEQRTVGEWGSFYYGHSCPKWSVTEDATTPCIRYGELYTKFGTKIDRVFSYTNMPTDKLRFSKGTEVLIPRVGEDPMDYNHCTWLSVPGIAIGEMISVYNTEQNPLFTATMFNARLQKEFASKVEGGSVTNLYYEKLKNINVLFPSLTEQEKIAAYFEQIDYLITLHQRKLNHLQDKKKGLLQKMFPNNGEKFPELRFPGFTDPWEQRKFSELFIERREKTKTEYEDTLLSCAIEGMFLNSELFSHFRGSTTIGYLKVKKNDLILSAQNLHLGNANVNLRFESGIISPAYKVYNLNNCNPYFINAWVKKDSTKNFFLMATTEGASQCRKNIEWNILNNQLINVPKIEEQIKIGGYFNELDNLITLHQRKLEHLQQQKKGLLQQMFI
ncbi:restriction endonuclease subunit S [Clostridium botulinum]|nr:restriction endonuclease subunit S [Clostridium botulinum]NFL45776.1 restriction endonuclease subunit S [Clostridium botulinum]NFL90041.1 restriction endonuclease subunit S [Clostridium botulinum]